jgi:hypothetical protein
MVWYERLLQTLQVNPMNRRPSLISFESEAEDSVVVAPFECECPWSCECPQQEWSPWS